MKPIVLVLGCCVVLGSGCATRALWEEGQFTRFREPASRSNLEVFQWSDSKVLVVYDEEADDGTRQKRRAFWADLNVEPPDNPMRPQFVRTESVNNLRRVPMVEVPTANDLCVVTNNAREFTLFKDGEKVWLYPLPVYDDKSGRVKQIALTPLTILADITIVGGVIGFYWVGGGGLNGTW